MVNARNWMTLAAIGVSFAPLGGCQSFNSNDNPRGFDERGNIERRYYEGGGVEIEWSADEPGTVYLVERSTQRILTTKTVEPGEAFTTVGKDWLQQAQSLTGAPVEDIRLDLYFVPDPPQK